MFHASNACRNCKTEEPMTHRARRVDEIMARELAVLDVDATVADAARQMRDRDIGDVLVCSGEQLRGIVTDRDLVVRCIAAGQDPGQTRLGSLCSQDLATVPAGASTDRAIKLMKEKAVRRIPVVEDGRAVGILSLGDLAENRDPRSSLGVISAAPPNH
jgi:CBS domain-containing protein